MMRIYIRSNEYAEILPRVSQIGAQARRRLFLPIERIDDVHDNTELESHSFILLGRKPRVSVSCISIISLCNCFSRSGNTLLSFFLFNTGDDSAS